MPPFPFAPGLRDRLTFALNRLREKLWVRPLLLCLVSLIGIVALTALINGVYGRSGRLALHNGERSLRVAQDVARLREAAAWILLPPGQGDKPWHLA